MNKAEQLLATEEADERCENCVFFERIIEDDSFRGHCLRYPPKISDAFIAANLTALRKFRESRKSLGSVGSREFRESRDYDAAPWYHDWGPWHFTQPQVCFDDWCGEFRERQQAQQETPE